MEKKEWILLLSFAVGKRKGGEERGICIVLHLQVLSTCTSPRVQACVARPFSS